MADRPTACPIWQGDLAGWLSAQLPPEQESALAAHLVTCETCRNEAHSLLEVAAVLLGTDPGGLAVSAAQDGRRQQPPPERGERTLATVDAANGQHRPRRRRIRSVRIGVAVLAVTAAVTLVLVLSVEHTSDPNRGNEVAFTVVPAGADVTAVMSPDQGGTVVQLAASGLEPEMTYALWMSAPGATWGDRVPAGTFRPDEDGSVDVTLQCAFPPSRYARVWATTPEGAVVLDTKR